MGLDSAFFRIHYEMKNAAAEKRLAGTIAAFAAVAGTLLFGLVLAASRPLAAALLGRPDAALQVVIAAADVYMGVFSFVPLNLLRIQERPGLFSLLNGSRHLVNTLLKIALVVQGYGVTGVLASDALASALLAAALAPALWRHAALALDPALLREALRFALPKLPHGLLLQVQNLADRKILDLFVSRAEVGLYQVGYSFGMGVKFPLSAFEPAWQPFVYAQIGKPEAERTLARVASVAWAAFLLVGVALAVLSSELLTLMTPRNPAFRAAAPIIPVVVLAYLLQGLFLLTSIGIGISKQARFYPLVTLVAATTNVAANFALVPRFGTLGAAWATVLSYAAVAALGAALSQRLHPVPWQSGRLAATSALGALAFAASRLAPEALVPALALKAALIGLLAVALFAIARRPA